MNINKKFKINRLFIILLIVGLHGSLHGMWIFREFRKFVWGSFYYTPQDLIAAAHLGDLKKLKEVLDDGVSPNASINHPLRNITALEIALNNNDKPIVQELLKHKAEVHTYHDTLAILLQKPDSTTRQ